MATATPIAVTRLTTDTVMEATSTMLDVLEGFGYLVLVSITLVVFFIGSRLPVDALRALAKDLC